MSSECVMMPGAPAYADVQYWPSYGFVCPSHATTNGNLKVLLESLKPADREQVTNWAETFRENPIQEARHEQ